MLVRTRGDPERLEDLVRASVRRVSVDQPVENFRTLEAVRSESIATERLTTTLISLFAGLATLITVTGVGGLIAFSVAQRTQEIGIRMALGATRVGVLAMVLKQGVGLVATGLALGVLGAVWLSNVLDGFLFETEPNDPLTFVAVAFVLVAATVVACLVPARRATSIDPVLALRVD